MRMLMRGRLSPDEVFPSGDERFRVSYVVVPQSGGLRVRVVECGPAASPDVVVCVHGWGCSAYSYRLVMPEVAARGRRVIAIDLPGHGLSDKPSDAEVYILDALVAVVSGVCDQLALGPAFFVGHSMGCPIVARLGVLEPERVRALVLVAPMGFGTNAVVKAATLGTPRIVAPLLPYVVFRHVIRVCLWMAYGRLGKPTERDVDEYWAPSQFPGFVRALRHLLHRFDWWVGERGGLERISAPVTLVYGTFDPLVSSEAIRRYSIVFPDARRMEVAGGGHAVPDEAPEWVIRAIFEVTH